MTVQKNSSRLKSECHNRREKWTTTTIFLEKKISVKSRTWNSVGQKASLSTHEEIQQKSLEEQFSLVYKDYIRTENF